ncbi:MAG: SatD family protein [Actinomycetota bacterium]|nr:SatD family protein [Actinomycetota bacterium]
MKNKKNKKVVVIMGDLISSSKVEGKNTLIKKIYKTINSINSSFSNEIILPLELTRGDEVSTVMLEPGKSFELCYLINKKISPDLFRFVIASGTIDNNMLNEAKNVNQVTGEVFYKASKMMSVSKRQKLFYNFSLDFKYNEFNQFLNSVANFLQLLFNKMTARQRETVDLYKKLHNQKEVARIINKKQQTVSSRLKSANWNYFEKGYNLINKILKNYNSYK